MTTRKREQAAGFYFNVVFFMLWIINVFEINLWDIRGFLLVRGSF